MERYRLEREMDTARSQLGQNPSSYRDAADGRNIVDYIMGHSEETALNHYFSILSEELIRQIQPFENLLPNYFPADPKKEDELFSEAVRRGLANKRKTVNTIL
ncbi:MAG: hypothetical protein ACM3Q4_11500 [Acidobacteriota bacterium]